LCQRAQTVLKPFVQGLNGLGKANDLQAISHGNGTEYLYEIDAYMPSASSYHTNIDTDHATLN
jgi:hypothetical protein